MDTKQVEYDQPNSEPTPKVIAGVSAGAVVTTLLALANLFGIAIPEDVSGAALTLVSGTVTIITFIAAYMKRDKKPEAVVNIIRRLG